MSSARTEACPGAYPGARATRVSFISVITCQGHPTFNIFKMRFPNASRKYNPFFLDTCKQNNFPAKFLQSLSQRMHEFDAHVVFEVIIA